MKTAIDILQNILLPKLEKDPGFDADKTNIAFWESLATMFLDYEKDAKPIYTVLYNLELNDPEKIISKLSNVYNSYIKELAEFHILGAYSKAIDYLLDSKNETFEKEVQFFSNLEMAIKKVERKRIKEALPTSYEKLTFELSEKDIELAIKKKGREALKEKMKTWDAELVSEEAPVISMPKKETKVISLFWVRYAVAACVVLGLGIWFYENQSQDVIPENTIVTAPDKKQPSSKPEVIPVAPTEALAEVSTVSKSLEIKEAGLGFASKTKKINIVQNNQKERILSIEKAIEKYRMQLEKEFATHKGGVGTRENELKVTIDSLNNELNKLKERENQYTFDGKKLTIYILVSPKTNDIILFEDQYYLHKENNFYKLSVSNKTESFHKETDSIVLKALDKIIFDNDN